MKKSDFRFTDEQRKKLLKCWKRPHEKALAVDFLDAAELTIQMWHAIAMRHPPTSRKEEQEQLDKLALKAKEMIRAFEGLPLGVDCAFPFVFHLDGFDKDYSNLKDDSRLMAESFPDFSTQADFCMDFLRRLKAAAENFGLERQCELPQIGKFKEVSLLGDLISDYQECFGKYPSASNAPSGDPGDVSPFRKFTTEIAKIIASKLDIKLIFGPKLIKEEIAKSKRDDLRQTQTRNI